MQVYGACGATRGQDQRVTAPASDVVAGGGQRVFKGSGVRRREFEHRLGTQAAHPGVGSGLGDGVLEVVHVGEAGHAAADHLGAGQQRSQPAKIRRDELTLDRHHEPEQPDVEAQVVGQTAQQRHRDVGMRVDQPRDQRLAAAVEGVGRIERGGDVGLGSDADDRIASDGDGAAADNAVLGVHGDDGGVLEDGVDFGHGGLTRQTRMGAGLQPPPCYPSPCISGSCFRSSGAGGGRCFLERAGVALPPPPSLKFSPPPRNGGDRAKCAHAGRGQGVGQRSASSTCASTPGDYSAGGRKYNARQVPIRAVDVIARKRDGHELSREEIDGFVTGFRARRGPGLPGLGLGYGRRPARNVGSRDVRPDDGDGRFRGDARPFPGGAAVGRQALDGRRRRQDLLGGRAGRRRLRRAGGENVGARPGLQRRDARQARVDPRLPCRISPPTNSCDS